MTVQGRTNFEESVSHHKLSWTVLFHPSYRPDLALSDFHLLRALKYAIRGTNLEDSVICILIT